MAHFLIIVCFFSCCDPHIISAVSKSWQCLVSVNTILHYLGDGLRVVWAQHPQAAPFISVLGICQELNSIKFRCEIHPHYCIVSSIPALAHTREKNSIWKISPMKVSVTANNNFPSYPTIAGLQTIPQASTGLRICISLCCHMLQTDVADIAELWMVLPMNKTVFKHLLRHP